MLNILIIEKQLNKRVHKFLLHKATEENIESANARLVINILIGNVSVHLFEQHRYIKTLSIRAIVEFFGKDYDETKINSLLEYLKKISQENNIEFPKINVVICETKGEFKAHLYNESKYVKPLSTIELLTTIY